MWKVKGKSRKAVTQAGDNGSLYQSNGGEKKELNPECILKVGPEREGLGVGGDRKRGVRDESTIFGVSVQKDGAATNQDGETSGGAGMGERWKMTGDGGDSLLGQSAPSLPPTFREGVLLSVHLRSCRH